MRQAPDLDGPGVHSSPLWGKKGKRLGISAQCLALVLVVVAACLAAGVAPSASAGDRKAYVAPALEDDAAAAPDSTFRVIVQPADGSSAASVIQAVMKAQTKKPGTAKGVRKSLAAIKGAAAELTGDQINALADDPAVSAITEDAPLAASGYSNTQAWPYAAKVNGSWSPTKATFPAIAVVDSGIDASKVDVSGRVLAQVSFVSSGPNSPGDGFGHGTMVASLAAGGGSSYTGAAPRAKLVSLDVLNDAGVGYMSDAIAACDWILQNKQRYNIRVANFSINAGFGSSFMYDPLDKAVEKLWLNGIVVVASAGNYGLGSTPSGVYFSPANDPFVITVGASDVNSSSATTDDFGAPWSAWGYTYDGFFKPEVAAPGRVMTAAVPASSTLRLLFPDRVVSSGYMWMSGTSFAAPVVSGAAAWALALHPSWTPDQVKGALMLAADVPSGYGSNGSLGVGVIDGSSAANLSSTPPNPNAGLLPFVKTDIATGLKVFDAASWSSAAQANASWNSASWNSASWNSASWSSASWSSASWSSASWSSASWNSASWNSASWNSASWNSASWSTQLAVR